MVFVGTQILRIVLMQIPLGKKMLEYALQPLEVPPGWSFSLRRWPLRNVLLDGVSLWNHSRDYVKIQKNVGHTAS